jgi:hypothetical protein
MASLPPELMPDAPKPSIDSSKLPIMNLTDPRQTIIGETIENLPPAPRPGPALPGAPVPQPPPSPVATALNAPAATPPTAAPSPVAAALNTPAGGAMPTTGGGGMNDRIAAMLESKDPYERRMARGVAQSIFAKRLEGEKPTDEMREYQLYRAQGGTKPFFDYKTDLAKAKAQNISVETKVETEQQKLAAKRFDALNSEITSSASSARTKIATLDRLGQLIDDPNIKTGKGAELILEAKKLAKTAGFDVGDLSGPEAMRAIGNQFVLELRNPSGGAGMPGAMSDSDRVFLQGMGPGLLNTPEGNRLIVDYMKRMAQRSLDVERLRRDYIKKNKHLDEGFYDALSEFSDKNPIFPEANKKQSAPAAVAAPPPPAAAPSGIDPAALEEARQRKLIP